MTEIDWIVLREAATAAMQRAYAPYSNFPVGAAALVEDGRVVVGCNVENASYGVTLCAECGVVSALHASGGGRLLALACVDSTGAPLMPCGRCRQLIWENGGPNCLVDAGDRTLAMSELLPQAFDRTDLDRSGAALPGTLTGYRGRGTVFIHPDMVGGDRVWTGYWERSTGAGDEPAGILQEAPNWPDTAEAVAWARARTHRVVVVDSTGATFWAGPGEAPEGMSRWPE
jgi:cytidine deaminase